MLYAWVRVLLWLDGGALDQCGIRVFRARAISFIPIPTDGAAAITMGTDLLILVGRHTTDSAPIREHELASTELTANVVIHHTATG